MKLTNIKTVACAALLSVTTFSSCDSYLDCPTEDAINTSNYYETAEQCRAGVNYLYNSPWYDFQRGFFKVGEVLSGNYYWSASPYLTFTLNGSDNDLANMSASLWSENTHAATVYDNLKNSTKAPEDVKKNCMGEALTWKAFAYFYLVRSFGSVPIIHNAVDIINQQKANDVRKAKISNVYDYIVKLLEEAITLLPESDGTGKGRLDKYCAKALLAKVYLTKSGFSEEHTKYNTGSYSYITCTAHQRNQADLDKAAELALDVIEHSGRSLEPVYSDLFRGDHNVCAENMISWAWSTQGNWTMQNSLQSDLAIKGFDEYGDCWGEWNGPSVDLQDAFGENALSINRMNVDDRRKATFMLPGDKYDYFYTDCGGFDYLKFLYNGYEDHKSPGKLDNQTGAAEVKHLYGDNADHMKYFNVAASKQTSALYTHLLRLADVYLIYCEAKIGNNGSTSDAKACNLFYQVRHRSVKSYDKDPSSITWEDVWKERRLELACEGDRWYDFVRRYYYDPEGAINELKSQRRNAYNNGDQLNELYKNYYENGTWSIPSGLKYNDDVAAPNVTDRSFTLPLPSSDITFNPLLMETPVDYDLSEITF